MKIVLFCAFVLVCFLSSEFGYAQTADSSVETSAPTSVQTADSAPHVDDRPLAVKIGCGIFGLLLFGGICFALNITRGFNAAFTFVVFFLPSGIFIIGLSGSQPLGLIFMALNAWHFWWVRSTEAGKKKREAWLARFGSVKFVRRHENHVAPRIRGMD